MVVVVVGSLVVVVVVVASDTVSCELTDTEVVVVVGSVVVVVVGSVVVVVGANTSPASQVGSCSAGSRCVHAVRPVVVLASESTSLVVLALASWDVNNKPLGATNSMQ